MTYPNKLLVTIEEACQLLSLPKNTFCNLVRAGYFRHVPPMKKNRRFPLSQIVAFAESAGKPEPKEKNKTN